MHTGFWNMGKKAKLRKGQELQGASSSSRTRLSNLLKVRDQGCDRSLSGMWCKGMMAGLSLKMGIGDSEVGESHRQPEGGGQRGVHMGATLKTGLPWLTVSPGNRVQSLITPKVKRLAWNPTWPLSVRKAWPHSEGRKVWVDILTRATEMVACF